MYTLTSLLIVCLLLAFTVNCLPSRIVGGNNAEEGKHPYLVSVRKDKNHICGGSIINQRHVLTAAHCVYGQAQRKFRVHAGSNYLNETGDEYLVERIIWHEGYTQFKRINDIALIRVNKDINFYEKVQPIALPSIYYVPPGETAVVSGWGRISVNGIAPIELQEIYLNVTSQRNCKLANSNWKWNVKDTHICTFTKKDEGVCNGDSGGPLVANGVQIGIVSFGMACAVGSPDVYTRVYSYRSWIDNNMQA